MNTERKEPKISGIRPDQDEIARHQRQKTRSTPTQTTSTRTSSQPVRPQVIVRTSKLGALGLFIALLASGAAGFTYWQLTLAHQSLADAGERLKVLENQLELSDDESNASMTAMQAKLKWADSEIRKLWAVSYDTNRKGIAANQTEVSALKESLAAYDGKLKAAVDSAKTEIQLVNELLEGQQSSVAKAESASQQQLKTVRELSDKLKSLERLESDLKSRISANEEAIKAIDGFRRNVSQQLLQLNGEQQQ